MRRDHDDNNMMLFDDIYTVIEEDEGKINHYTIKSYMELDKKTQTYVTEEKKKIGLLESVTSSNYYLSHRIKYVNEYEANLSIVKDRMTIMMNDEGHIFADVCFDAKYKHYLYHVFGTLNGKQTYLSSHRFEREVNAEDVLRGLMLLKITSFLARGEYSSPYIQCLFCDSSYHWTDVEGTLEEKWYTYIFKSCPCEESSEKLEE